MRANVKATWADFYPFIEVVNDAFTICRAPGGIAVDAYETTVQRVVGFLSDPNTVLASARPRRSTSGMGLQLLEILNPNLRSA